MTFENGRQGINVENVILWRESLTTMKDTHFFDLLRMYLGEIKTPYNKQRLTEQLAGFLRKSENIQNLISFLDEFDLQILTAVSLFPRATETLLIWRTPVRGQQKMLI